MALNCNTKHPLQHDGTSQHQRFLEALEPSFVKIHEFDLRDWMRFAYHFAAKLKYFSVNDDQKPDGNWQAFLKSEEEIESFLKDAALVENETWLSETEREKILRREPQGNYEPHLALFLSFLKLLKFQQEQINGLSKRHLDFYYKEVLQLSLKPAVPDRVHLIFELAKNAGQAILANDTQLEGGKDKNGKPLFYSTGEELVVNQATVAMLKSVFHQQGESIRYAEQTDSLDGLGTEFTDEHPNWQAFGNETWPAASLGFALASKVLLLKEGTRNITVELSFAADSIPADFPDKEKVQSQFLVLLSGEKDWIQATDFEVGNAPRSRAGKLRLTVQIDAAEKAIVPYDPKIHEERFNTDLPVLRVLINIGTEDGYSVYAALEKAIITEVNITVEVSGIKDINLENDQGKLDGSKPFYPFGTQPRAGSNFYLGSAEIFQKNWEHIKLNVAWKNKPFNLQAHYAAYTDGGVTVTGDDYFTFKARYLKDNKWFPEGVSAISKGLFDELIIERDASDSGFKIATLASPLLIKKGVDVNKAVLKNYLAKQTLVSPVKQKKIAKPVSAKFEIAKFNPGFLKPMTMIAAFSQAIKADYLRLTLDKSFLQEYFVNLMTKAMIKIANEETANIPNDPYTPQISSFTVDYKASAINKFAFGSKVSSEDKFRNFKDRSIQLFHEQPFGQSEQHVFLKEQCAFLDPNAKRNIRLLPAYAPEGEFYIGLEKANASDMVSLLIQALEGSEDPLAPTFTGNQAVEWFALVNNEWQPLNDNFVSKNSTNNLLRAGIVRIQLPAGANSSNTLLDSGFHWIKAQLPAGLKYTSVCRIAGIHAQAVEASFNDRDNELSHLAASVPAETIKKFIAKPPLVKGVNQPYATFGGAAIEQDVMFYQRVSERLRHKNRAVNIWDYERLVLQEFPSVYKVKCLNHTSINKQSGTPDYFEINPGFVSLIVIPDIRNQDSFDPLQPRASQNLLREIEDYIAPLNSLHVKFDADNPDYETLFLDFRVKFYNQFDPNAYLKILNADIVRYLSPWAFGDFSDISFGGSIYKSVVIGFIEERPYIDFVSQVRMYHRKGEVDTNTSDVNFISASSARAILVSAIEHQINLIDNDLSCNE
jgi:hypothetical protein